MSILERLYFLWIAHREDVVTACRLIPACTPSPIGQLFLPLCLLFFAALLVELFLFAAEAAGVGIEGVVPFVGVLGDHLVADDAVLSETDVPAVADGVDGVLVVFYGV